MLRLAMALCAAASLAGCAEGGLPATWHKDGATSEDWQRDSYECERDVRAASGSFTRGVLFPIVEAQEFGARCMNSKGWSYY